MAVKHIKEHSDLHEATFKANFAILGLSRLFWEIVWANMD